jgi:hypothetical protein
MAALDSAHTALALGCRTLLVPRISSSDLRARHRGLSHHTSTVLDLLLAPVAVAVPVGHGPQRDDQHRWIERETDLAGYTVSGLPVRSMGREDPLFFEAALAAGGTLADMIAR